MPMRVRWVQIGEITAQEDTRLLRALRKPLIPGVYTQGGYQSRDVRFRPKVGQIAQNGTHLRFCKKIFQYLLSW